MPIDLDITYEDLLEQKLAGVSPALDKREGTSLIYNATAANTIEIIQMLDTLRNQIDLVFADTAPREYLIRRAAERGDKPLDATRARLKGVFNRNVNIGERFSLEELNYVVTQKITDFEYVLESETVGEVGNLYLGTLIPINYIDGLTSAELVEVLVPGEDEEDTEVFRERYFDNYDSTAFGGNRKDYKDRVRPLPGVGGVKVYRAWNGGGTVKLVIIDSQFKVPTQSLVNEVQEKVDPLYAQGEGVGLAPMDHIVTVFPVEGMAIDVVLNIAYQTDWTWQDIEANVHTVIDNYFTELAKEWAGANSYEEDHTGLVVRISQIETRILGVPGVVDIANTQLNGGTSNIVLSPEAIPKRGVVSG